jgi:hypothetical protein
MPAYVVVDSGRTDVVDELCGLRVATVGNRKPSCRR